MKIGNANFVGNITANGTDFSPERLNQVLTNATLWRSTTSYSSGDFVSYQNKLYYSNVDSNLNVLPTNTTNWTEYQSTITVDATLNSTSTNAIQNKAVYEALDTKITAPSDGVNGQILSKTSSGTSWINQISSMTATNITITDSGNNYSSTSVEGALGEIGTSLSNKITNPSGGTSGQVLSKTSDGTAWINASSGVTSYNDLTDKPTIPSKTSDLTNDSGYLTVAPVTSVNGMTGEVVIETSGFSSDYNDLTNKPTIPVNSDFTLNGLSEKSFNNLTDKPSNSSYSLSGLNDVSILTSAQYDALGTKVQDKVYFIVGE